MLSTSLFLLFQKALMDLTNRTVGSTASAGHLQPHQRVGRWPSTVAQILPSTGTEGSKCDLQDREQMIRLDLAVSYPPNTDRAAKRLKLNHVAFTRQLLKQLTIVQSARFQGQT